MRDETLRAWARVLTGYCTAVQPGQRVLITGETAAEPLMRAVFREVIAAGGFPVLWPVLSGLHAALLAHGTDEQVEYISPIERFTRQEADVSIRIIAERNTRSSSQIDPERSAVFTRARSGLQRSFMERAAQNDLRWSLTIFPTDAYAQDADMSTADFEQFVYRACKLNHPDPVAAWNDLHDEQARLIDWLAGKEQFRIVGPETDLTLSVEGRTWINSDGKRNFPSGEIFTGPVETSATGTFSCGFPVIHAGRRMTGVKLRFVDGLVVDASAANNEAYLLEALDTDEGARRLGEVAIGTNFDIDRFTGQTLLDEKIGGTAHIAIGAGYPETGSVNRSAIHWDLITDLRKGGRIEVDGQPMLVDGRFVI
ncbi:MAG: aminopeptidase [Thermomicrobiales bacterium]